MLRVCISGLGKTGREIAKVLLEQDDLMVVSAICSPNSEKKGKDLGEVIGCKTAGIIVESSDNIEEVVFKTKPDVVVDFSSTSASLKNARVFSKMKVNMVIATTGFSKMALKKLFIYTRKYHNGIIYTPNITLGVNVLMLITNLAANILNDYDFQISEIHHKHKKDSPSGTALKIAKEVEKGLESAGVKVEENSISINAVRAGGVVGKHDVMIIGENDKIEISHESFSRKAFALGAIRAVKFIVNKTGYYEMSDVLNLKKVLSDYIEKDSGLLSRKYRQNSAGIKDPRELWA